MSAKLNHLRIYFCEELFGICLVIIRLLEKDEIANFIKIVFFERETIESVLKDLFFSRAFATSSDSDDKLTP